jgi:hypothetical protein
MLGFVRLCVINIDSVSGLSILYCPSVFSNVYLPLSVIFYCSLELFRQGGIFCFSIIQGGPKKMLPLLTLPVSLNFSRRRLIVRLLGGFLPGKSLLNCRRVTTTDFVAKYASTIFNLSCTVYRVVGSIEASSGKVQGNRKCWG